MDTIWSTIEASQSKFNSDYACHYQPVLIPDILVPNEAEASRRVKGPGAFSSCGWARFTLNLTKAFLHSSIKPSPAPTLEPTKYALQNHPPAFCHCSQRAQERNVNYALSTWTRADGLSSTYARGRWQDTQGEGVRRCRERSHECSTDTVGATAEAESAKGVRGRGLVDGRDFMIAASLRMFQSLFACPYCFQFAL